MIHQYQNNGYNIVLDVNSGSVHVVDDLLYEMIAQINENGMMSAVSHMKKTYGEEQLDELIQDIEELKAAGQLFTPDEYEELVSSFKQRDTVIKALCLHIAHDCNLACKYCFAEEGEYHTHRDMMTPEIGKRAIDFLIQHSGNRTNLEVDFFGGEPLMNWGTVKEIVEYGRTLEEKYNKKFRFTLTTNGVLLDDEIIEFANREMSNVVLSIDGRPHIHDKMRPTRNHKGSYDTILPKLKKIVDSRAKNNYYVRGTFTHYNLDFAEDVMCLANEGFDQISMEPVVALPHEEYAITCEDVEQVKNEYDRLAQMLIQREKEGIGVNFFHFKVDLKQGPCVVKRLSGCGSGTEYLAVTPWGDLYPCHQFVGIDEFKLGSVEKGILKQDLVNEFKVNNVYAKPKCKACWARFYCSGGCAANGYKFHGDLHDAYDIGCELEKKRIECAIMIQAAFTEEDEHEIQN